MTRRIALLLVPLSLAVAPRAQARITRIVYTTTPAFGGKSFGDVGTFDKLVGTAFGEVDPRDPRNAIIQDIELAPRNARGMVEYSADLYLIKPHDMAKGNRILFYNVHNRGNKGGLNTFNLGVQGNPPAPAGNGCGQNDPIGAGDGFLQERGFTIIWSGWQPDVLPGNCRLTAKVPVAHHPGGSTITGIVRSELKLGPGATAPLIVQNLSAGHFTNGTHAPYATVSTDNQKRLADGFVPTLTKRLHVNDPRVPIPNGQWFFASSCTGTGGIVPSQTQICLPAGFQPGVLYELIYRAKDPTVLTLGWAGMRDLISFFKHARQDDVGTPNPLFLEPEARDRRDDDDEEGDEDDGGKARDRAGTLAVFEGSSQSGRSMRTFLHLGFNEDEHGRIVFEGAYPHIGGGRLPMNTRFSAPGRAWGFTVDHLYPAYEFPFTYRTVHDPLTHQTDGILERCRRSHTCPKIFHVATALEIWEGRQSLGFTDPRGKRDLPDAKNTRAYIMASTQHGSAAFNPVSGPAFGDCEQQQNPNPQAETMRALWVAFTDWVKDGREPPPSTKPRVDDGTFVPPEKVNFPSIPANSYANLSPDGPAARTNRPAVRWQHVATPLHVLDYGPLFNGLDETGVITDEPPSEGKEAYGVRVPQVDADGNDLGGIRDVTIQAPLGTYTGWNMGAPPVSPGVPGRFEDGLCSLSGSYIPFAQTRGERVPGDSRRALEERYPRHDDYVAAVTAAANRLVKQRFLLQADADRLILQAANGKIRR
jgi:alpha/beta hydrolase family protein